MGDISKGETKNATWVTHCLSPSNDSQGYHCWAFQEEDPTAASDTGPESNLGKFSGGESKMVFSMA